MAEESDSSTLRLNTCNVIRLLKENEFRFSKHCNGVARELNIPLEERGQQLNCSDCFEECIDYWLRNSREPSWGKLTNIIAKFDRKSANEMRKYLNLPKSIIQHSVSVDTEATCTTEQGDDKKQETETSADSNDTQLADLLKSMTLEDAQQIDINCKVYNADTNSIIQATTPPLTRDIVLKHRSKRVQSFDTSTVTIGTSVRIEISADSNCYMYIINIGTSGKTSLLLPNECELNNYFCANQIYRLPDEEIGSFEISGPPGKETIQVLAFSNRQTCFDKLITSSTNDMTRDLYRDITFKRKSVTHSIERKGFAQIQFNVK